MTDSLPLKMPTIESDQLLLRSVLPSDAAAIQQLAGNRAIADTTLNIPHPYEDGLAEVWISTHQADFDAGKSVTFAVTPKANADLVGVASLSIDQRFGRGELGYWIGEPFWGLGYCTEAARTVVQYAFSERGLHRVHAAHLSRNPASGRVMQKIGMSLEGVARQHIKKWDCFEDLVLYGLLRSEWEGEPTDFCYVIDQ